MTDSLHRMGTATMYNNTLRNLHARQSTLVALEENMSAGKRVLRASDDPLAAATAERALARMSQLEAAGHALALQQGRITQAETALGEAIDIVQQIRELVVAAGNASHASGDFQTHANQIRQLREQLTDIINRKDTHGQPLLGGLGSALKTFTGSDFNGLPGQIGSSENGLAGSLDGHWALIFDPVRDGVYHAHIAPRGAGSSLTTSPVHTAHRDILQGASYRLEIDSVTVDKDGARSISYTLHKTNKDGHTSTSVGSCGPVAADQPLPLEINEGGHTVVQMELHGTPAKGDTITIAPSRSLIGSIEEAIGGIGGASSKADVSQAVGQALANIDAGLEHLRQTRSYAGELLNRAERLGQQHSQRGLQLEAERSNAEDIDLLKGLSDLQNARTAHQAALQSYAQVQRLSLFDYLR